jgi:hypothetical protein
MPAKFVPTRPPLATPDPENPELTMSISIAGNISGPELGGGTEQLFAEFVVNKAQLDDWSKDEDGGKEKMREWLGRQVDERYSTVVRQRETQAPPPPPAEEVSMADLADLFGTPKGKTPVLELKSTHIDRGTDPAEEALEEAGRTRRRLFGARRKEGSGEEKPKEPTP